MLIIVLIVQFILTIEIIFEKLLKRMAKLYPDIYSIRLWYAKTLENNDPVELYKQLDKAIEILGSDSEVYRIGIKNAFMNQDKNKLKEYCMAYLENQLGGIKFADRPWVFNGIGLRSMNLELINKDKKIFIKNNGLSLNKNNGYEFLIPEEIKINSNFYLHIAVSDGLKLKIKNSFFFRGDIK